MMVAPARWHFGDGPLHAASLLSARPPACEVLVEDLDRCIERRMGRSRPHVAQRVASSLDNALCLAIGEDAVFLEPDEELEDEGPGRHPERANRNCPAFRPTLRHDRLPFPQQSAVDPTGTNRRPLPRRRGRGARDAASMNSFTFSAATDAPLGDCPAAAILPGGRRHPFDRSPCTGAREIFAQPGKFPDRPARDDALSFRNLRRDERALHAHRYGGVDVQEVGPGVQAHGI